MTHAHEHDHEGHDHHHEHVDYPDAVRAFRADKDDAFRGHDSPLPAADRDAFMGLPYFPVDQAMRFEGLRLEPYQGGEPASFQIPTSDGQLRPAQRAGVFRFEIEGAPQTLTGYTFAGGDPDESVFVPFLDQTSGTETYGAGRYLDLYPEDDGSYALDFNLAYHPSCVYDARFSCPLTPAENRLSVRIEAGERLPIGRVLGEGPDRGASWRRRPPRRAARRALAPTCVLGPARPARGGCRRAPPSSG